MSEDNVVGSIGWVDLTVEDAERLRDFYAEVVGWKAEPVSMGDYSDFNMVALDGNPRAGICHARGPNADLPAQWLVYVTVRDLEASVARCLELGGRIISAPRGAEGQDRFCVIQDPAGAVMALHAPPARR